MGKLDIGVGDEFPVDEPPPRTPEDEDAVRAAREEWERQREEWRHRKDEWRSQRQAWKEEMRSKSRAFKSDLRRSFHENFGERGFRLPPGILPRLLIVLGAIALAIALLPFLFMFGFLALAVMFFIGAMRSGRSDYRPPSPNPPQAS